MARSWVSRGRVAWAAGIVVVGCAERGAVGVRGGEDDDPADAPGSGGGTGGDPAAPLPCHPWDPIRVAGGTRTYTVLADQGVSVETHTLGAALPDGWNADVVAAMRVEADAAPASDVRRIHACDLGDDGGAYEVGFDGLVLGVDMVGETEQPVRYLPEAQVLDDGKRVSWSAEASVWALSLDLDIRNCPSPLPLVRTTSASFGIVGFEPVDLGRAGAFDAVHVLVDQTEQLAAGPGVSETCRTQLARADVIGPGATTDAQLHRWYARGVGLLVALTTDPSDPACATPRNGVVPTGCTPAVDRRLTACDGLAGC